MESYTEEEIDEAILYGKRKRLIRIVRFLRERDAGRVHTINKLIEANRMIVDTSGKMTGVEAGLRLNDMLRRECEKVDRDAETEAHRRHHDAYCSSPECRSTV